MEAIYTATATANGGRNGHVSSSDGVIELDLKAPAAMGGEGGKHSNPEQLFAAGWAACFNGALNVMISKKRAKPTGDVSVRVSVSINKDQSDGGFILSGDIVATMPGVPQDVADELMHEAHAFCPYSKATSGNIEVSLTAKV